MALPLALSQFASWKLATGIAILAFIPRTPRLFYRLFVSRVNAAQRDVLPMLPNTPADCSAVKISLYLFPPKESWLPDPLKMFSVYGDEPGLPRGI